MSDRFLPLQLLKRDLFSQVERGVWRPAAGIEQQAVRRDIRGTPWWTRPLAWLALRREARALRALDAVGGVPRLLARGRGQLIRTWIDGQPLHQARPADPGWFAAAGALVDALHAAGVTHNDLHKEPNWLVRADGGPALVDFQLASLRRWPRWLCRLLQREDQRHLLKHKRRYCPDALVAAERDLLAAPAWTTRVWRVTGKRLYNLITRRLLRWSDQEGRGRGLGPLHH